MRSIRAILVVAALAACDPMPAPAPTPSAAGVDSISLERTRCFGLCPAYRLSSARDGAVRYQSRNPDDSTTATGRIGAAAFDSLVREAERISFRSFPDMVVADQELCGPSATDHPGATVTIQGSEGAKSVNDYHGCHGKSERLAELRRFQNRIDSVAGASQWVRPPTRR
jgi:hypothetical protein